MNRAALLALLLLNLGITGCAALPNGKHDPRDRFERFNRSVYKFNTALDHAVLRPVARAYVRYVPGPIRTSLSNFTSNLAYPTTVANDVFQGKITDGVSDAARIIVNTTIGIGGLFDPATRMGLDRHTQDFGLTLGRWGVPSGPYLMLPLLGPSTVRDTAGLGPDYLLTYEIVSRNLITNNYVSGGLFVVTQIDRRAGLLDTDKALDAAYDPYGIVRSAYLQRRNYLLRGDETPDDLLKEDESDNGGKDKPDPPK
ncbi:MAG TPA: VacJ family lipoprotein [Steroidobacteraceae bacterium]|jgi:phospholipid-binding lipoprotein MlaA|nr:VacJ family lipoprotein [Steroidobacteraceae bacterium]